MELELKEQITEEVNKWIDDKNSQRSAAKLSEKSGVSTAYISKIKNGEYEVTGGGGRVTIISDNHFYKLAEAIGIKLDDEFKWDFLNSFKMVQRICRKAQRKQLRIVLDGETGQGKTFGLEWYNRENDYVLYVKCTQNMTAKALVNTICQKLQIDLPTHRTPYEKLEMIRKVVTNRRGYVIILDECGKREVKPGIYSVIKDIADFVQGKCGLVICGYKIVDMLQTLHDRHVPGYRQIGRRFLANQYEVPVLTTHDVSTVCESEGITNAGAVNVLKKYVHDLDMLSQYVRDIKAFQTEKGKKITGDEVIDTFGINITNLKAA